MQREKLISEDSVSKIVAKWDGTRFAIVWIDKVNLDGIKTVIILNPKEAMNLLKFIGSLGVEV